jgi:hypothetical protein
MTIIAFFLLRTDLIPCKFPMNALLIAFQVAAKEAAVPIAFELLPAGLTGYAVVVAYSFEMLTDIHVG